MNNHRFTLLLATIAVAGCAQTPLSPDTRIGERSLRQARSKTASAETRAAFYLKAAAQTAPKPGQGNMSPGARETYNAASGELAALLRSAEGGRLWNRPLTLSADGTAYQLRLEPGNKQGVWAPDYFTAFVPAKEVPLRSLKYRNVSAGIGGALVGIRKQTPREPFASKVGITAPVTATLEFEGKKAMLALRDPNRQPKARVEGAERPLAADFSAPLAYYPHINQTIAGLMGAIKVGKYMDITGLYMLEPYDPNRIPLIFVHGLISTPQLWRSVINEIEADPVLRARFQCWVFAYPTGNPAAYSALRFRQELAKAKQKYGFPHGIVLVGHSMGGILSRMQTISVTRADWDRTINAPSAKALLTCNKKGSLVHDCLIFNANPDVKRVIFICTPHRGSNMAINSIGQIGMRLISLPSSLVDTVQKTTGDTLKAFIGKETMPNSIYSLSPTNPTMKVVDSVPIRIPHHTIYGDRGKKGPPSESSDGVVPYWSSHLDSAASEKAVPGPHSACEMKETIAELQRLLHLHLKQGENR